MTNRAESGILKDMEAVYQLKPDELTDDFFKAVKEHFAGREIKITIEDQQPQDETEYLLRNEENRKHLLAGVKAVKEGRCSHSLTLEEIEAMAQ